MALGMPKRVPFAHRRWAGIIALGCLTVLVVAAVLRPDPSGMGTHQQLGLPPCGFKSVFGLPCPTCGMTTSFTNAAHAHPVAAVQAQPFGAILALISAITFWLSLHVAITGSTLGLTAGQLIGPRLPWLLIGGLLAGWSYTLLTAHT